LAVAAEDFGVLLFLVNAVGRRQCQLGSLHLLCKHEIFPEQKATKKKGLQLVLAAIKKRILNPPLLFCCTLALFESMLEVMEASDDDDVVVGDFCSILMIAGVPANEAASRLLDVVTSDT
jgi:hypothetical protein